MKKKCTIRIRKSVQQLCKLLNVRDYFDAHRELRKLPVAEAHNLCETAVRLSPIRGRRDDARRLAAAMGVMPTPRQWRATAKESAGE